MCGRIQPGLCCNMTLFRVQASKPAAISMDFRRAAMLREGPMPSHAMGDY
jgi:hypothetical protein